MGESPLHLGACVGKVVVGLLGPLERAEAWPEGKSREIRRVLSRGVRLVRAGRRVLGVDVFGSACGMGTMT